MTETCTILYSIFTFLPPSTKLDSTTSHAGMPVGNETYRVESQHNLHAHYMNTTADVYYNGKETYRVESQHKLELLDHRLRVHPYGGAHLSTRLQGTSRAVITYYEIMILWYDDIAFHDPTRNIA